MLILLFTRRRASEVIRPIRAYRPRRIYLSGDGPRPDRPGEAAAVERARREWLEAIDWPCVVRVRFSAHNDGCRHGVSRGLDWFFSHEPEGIIIEEDCLVASGFLPFADELLERYRADHRITSITAQNEQGGIRRGPESYYFSEIAHCWGWASWRRAWKRYREVEARLPQLMEDGRVFASSSYPLARKSWPRWCERVCSGELDSWAIIWSITNLAHRGLSVVPNVNLVRNLGFDEEATHTHRSPGRNLAELGEVAFPLVHPEFFCADTEADAFDYRHCYGWKNDWLRAVKGVAKRSLRRVVRGFGRLVPPRSPRWSGMVKVRAEGSPTRLPG